MEITGGWPLLALREVAHRPADTWVVPRCP